MLTHTQATHALQAACVKRAGAVALAEQAAATLAEVTDRHRRAKESPDTSRGLLERMDELLADATAEDAAATEALMLASAEVRRLTDETSAAADREAPHSCWIGTGRTGAEGCKRCKAGALRSGVAP